MDWTIIDNLVDRIKSNGYDYCAYTGYPVGICARVFDFNTFCNIDKSTLTDSEIEHVTPVFYNHPEIYKVDMPHVDFEKFRLSVDTNEEFLLMEQLYENLYKGQPIPNEKVYEYLRNNPHLSEINKNVQQVKA